MRAFLLGGLVVAAVGLGFLACNPNSIGRPCVNPNLSSSTGTKVVSPALECPSRLCLFTDPLAGTANDGGTGGTMQRAICTASCENQDECAPETDVYCPSKKFVCAIATETGPNCCRKFCICSDDLEEGKNKGGPPDGGIVIPDSCNTMKNPNPTCPNARPYKPGQF